MDFRIIFFLLTFTLQYLTVKQWNKIYGNCIGDFSYFRVSHNNIFKLNGPATIRRYAFHCMNLNYCLECYDI